MPGHSTTDTIFFVCQLQKFHVINMTLYMAFVWKRHSIVYPGRHLVGSLHAGHLGVAWATHTEHVWKCQKQSVCWLTNRWQTRERRHSTTGEALGGAILLLPREQLILRWRLWTSHQSQDAMSHGQIQWDTAPPYLPLISNLEEEFIICALGDGCACGVTTKDQVSLQDPLERMQLDDLAMVLP